MILLVTTFHISLVGAGWIHHGFCKKPNPKRIQVHTFVQKEPTKHSSISTEPSSPKKPKPSLKKSKLSPSTSTPLKNPNPPSHEVDAAALDRLAHNLSKLSKSSANARTSLSVPGFIKQEATILSTNSSYQQYGAKIVDLFQTHLHLPEIGLVTALIRVNAEGRIAFIKILEEKSVKNSAFLKNELQQFQLPCFNEEGISESHLEFTITFRNAEHS